jgi:hypothetical protein
MRTNLKQHPLSKVVGKVRRVLGTTEIKGETVEIAVMDELLECGHSQTTRLYMYGAETLAAKRRCYQCPPQQP